MPDKYNVSWMSINIAKVSADNPELAIVAAMRAAGEGMEGVVDTKAHPTMRIENMRTHEVTLVTVDADYKVVKTHEHD